jgi:hypothetical protein
VRKDKGKAVDDTQEALNGALTVKLGWESGEVMVSPIDN